MKGPPMGSFPCIVNNTKDKPLLEVPADSGSYRHEGLGYLDGYDAPINTDYAYLVYKETSVDNGEWKVRIKASVGTGVVFDPPMMRDRARQAAAQGQGYFTWGAGMTPSEGDPRQVEYRVHQAEGKPSAIEIVLTLRKFDGSADKTQQLMVDWPR
ncbi:MAG: hypothetical protein KF866_11430 [Phycisphaeraceae bacterium]|nr:hypothetical protein [Phycisphaeraceae bacterium]MCW5754215.1 hypothetical protein [Phycisphaeraceae bacterium]